MCKWNEEDKTRARVGEVGSGGRNLPAADEASGFCNM